MKNLFSKRFNKKTIIILSASLLTLIAILGYTTFELTKKTVALTLNGEETELKTHAKTVEDVLAKLNITLHEEDYVYPSPSTKLGKDAEVVWKQAQQVTLVEADTEKSVWTTAETIADLLVEQNITLTDHDNIHPEQTEEIVEDMKVNIEYAFPLTVVVGGEEQQTWTTEQTVAKLLEQESIELGDLDRVEPDLDQVVTEDSVVNVVRVESVTDIIEEEVDFATVTKKDGSLNKGNEKVITKGKKGILKKEYEVVLENGKEVSRNLIAETEVQKKQDQVVAVGTKSASVQVSRGSQARMSSGKEYTVTATAYTPNCNGCSGRTAAGINIAANPHMKLIAVDPRVIPLGTKVFVEGYGTAIAGDTGGSIKGNKIDVLFPTKSEAYRWGRRTVKIKVLN